MKGNKRRFNPDNMDILLMEPDWVLGNGNTVTGEGVAPPREARVYLMVAVAKSMCYQFQGKKALIIMTHTFLWPGSITANVHYGGLLLETARKLQLVQNMVAPTYADGSRQRNCTGSPKLSVPNSRRWF